MDLLKVYNRPTDAALRRTAAFLDASGKDSKVEDEMDELLAVAASSGQLAQLEEPNAQLRVPPSANA